MQNWLKLLIIGLAVLAVVLVVLWASGAFAADARLRTWTAPPADSLGSGGPDTAAAVDHYDLRYLDHPITPANWDSATVIQVDLIPKQPGAAESLLVADLPNGVWYFAIKSMDRAGNWSGLSNVAAVKVDRIPPAIITDLK